RGQEALLGPRAEALHAPDSSRAARGLEALEAVDPERVLQRADAGEAQRRDPGQLEHAPRQLVPQSVEQPRSAGPVELFDHARERRPDAAQLLEPLLANERREVERLSRERARSPDESLRPERVPARDREPAANL